MALLISSDISHLYSKGTTSEGLRDVGAKYSLLQVVDDNDSIKKESMLIITDFEGTVTLTVKNGAQVRLSCVAVTSNIYDVRRGDRFCTGRCILLKKEFKSYQEPEWCIQSINDAGALTSTRMVKRSPWMPWSDPVNFISIKLQFHKNTELLRTVSSSSRLTGNHLSVRALADQDLSDDPGHLREEPS